jgi:hypothetical protein
MTTSTESERIDGPRWRSGSTAITQAHSSSSPSGPPSTRGRSDSSGFFHAPAITVGDTSLSLDRIENGLLRGGRSKYGLGYLPKIFVTAFERRYRLMDCDPRIHFALNCGAESCPAIRACEPDHIDEQLDRATGSYLDATVEHDPDADTVRVPRLFLWFRGDFGGGSGIRSFLRTYDAIPEGVTPRIRHGSWDWAKAAGKFTE